ncbi:hypothetical protein CCAX7_58010 [Capsulimonas corticalis]|uniref:Uncharacterized protein n=1 Tax=Capsulimonas corticalis TaxID=2219043 RepID=A0A402D080_9BACT|nr:hypothetical protein [Capsulimonas corticalis]BDI33750.1 hypothetical protein CCAX7_58010 [Capsulimonas corticalis]
MNMQNMTQKQKTIASAIAIVVILVLGGRLVAQAVDVIAPDNLPGYFALAINPNPNMTPEQNTANMGLGMCRLSISIDHTYRFGDMRGSWRHSGDTLSLTPDGSGGQAFQASSMAAPLSAMTKPIDLKVGKDGKTLSAPDTGAGPLNFTKTSDAMR